MKLLRCLILVLTLGLSLPLMAQGGVVSLVKKVGTLIDSMSVKGVDRRYIDAPEKPWQLILKGNVSQTIVSMHTQGSMYGEEYSAHPHLKTTPAQYLGLWAGYRGYGFGYTVNVGGDKGSYLTFGATGGAFGINVRIHSFDNRNPTLDLSTDLIAEDDKEDWSEVQLVDPIHVNTVIADGYYLFNGKRFSYAAAYDQSAIQKRSAGSIMVGAMYYYARIKYNDNENADFILLMDNIGLHKMWQFGVGAGYAYNWVPCRGLLVSGMAIPMLMFYNHHKTWRYDSNLRQLALDIEEYDEEDLPKNEWVLYEEPLSVTRNNSRVTWNLDCRLSITYQWSRFYLNANGQYSTIQYKEGNVKGHLFDWFINASAGVRF